MTTYCCAVQAFEFDFVKRQPAAPLSRLVESLWFARGTVPYHREKIAPTGSTVAVFVLGDPIIATADAGSATSVRNDRGFLIGAHDAPVINEPTGETYAVGIVTTAVGCAATFGAPARTLAGRVVELEATWSAARDLRKMLLTAPPADALRMLEEALERDVMWRVPGLDRCEAVVALLEAEPTRPIAEIAAEVGVTHSYLDRQFRDVVGLSPRRFSRLLRLRRLLNMIARRDDVDWTTIAADAGWFDQSHLIRDFKRHTGVTPRQYIIARRSVTSSVEAADTAGFVPESGPMVNSVQSIAPHGLSLSGDG